MTCEQLEVLLLEYLGGELGEGQVREVIEHLEECDCCGNLLSSYRMTVELARLGRSGRVPVPVVERIAGWLSDLPG